MTIIKNLIYYSDDFIKTYESWYNENFNNNNLLWDYNNLLEFFKYKSGYKLHYLICHQHVTIEYIKTGVVKFFTGEDSYKNTLKYLYELHNCDYKELPSYSEYDIYPYYN